MKFEELEKMIDSLALKYDLSHIELRAALFESISDTLQAFGCSIYDKKSLLLTYLNEKHSFLTKRFNVTSKTFNKIQKSFEERVDALLIQKRIEFLQRNRLIEIEPTNRLQGDYLIVNSTVQLFQGFEMLLHVQEINHALLQAIKQQQKRTFFASILHIDQKSRKIYLSTFQYRHIKELIELALNSLYKAFTNKCAVKILRITRDRLTRHVTVFLSEKGCEQTYLNYLQNFLDEEIGSIRLILKERKEYGKKKNFKTSAAYEA